MTLFKPRILFVDDHDDTRALIALLLEQSHYDVTTASSFADSLKLIRSGSFNLYIFDSWLPDGSGIDLCKQVREFDHGTPILFYSAAAYESDKDLAFKAGAQAYLVKPVEVSDLLKMIRSQIPKRRKIRVGFERRQKGRARSTSSISSGGQTTLL